MKKLDDENDEIVRDGEHVIVPLYAMDAVQRAVSDTSAAPVSTFHRPGEVQISDNERTKRAAVYDTYNKALSDRWKNPSPLSRQALKATDQAPSADRATMYDRYDKALSERWRAA